MFRLSAVTTNAEIEDIPGEIAPQTKVHITAMVQLVSIIEPTLGTIGVDGLLIAGVLDEHLAIAVGKIPLATAGVVAMAVGIADLQITEQALFMSAGHSSVDRFVLTNAISNVDGIRLLEELVAVAMKFAVLKEDVFSKAGVNNKLSQSALVIIDTKWISAQIPRIGMVKTVK